MSYGDIPRSVERAAWHRCKIERALAHTHKLPYCFECDRRFKDTEALDQHDKAVHSKALEQ